MQQLSCSVAKRLIFYFTRKIRAMICLHDSSEIVSRCILLSNITGKDLKVIVLLIAQTLWGKKGWSISFQYCRK